MDQDLGRFREDFTSLGNEIRRVIVGQDEVIDGALAALFCGGHALLDGEPGLGKTLLVRTLADALDMQFRRIQFTSDLMPADVIGTYVVMESHGRRQFEFQQGPMFANLLLADEINRATPKTQAALLEGLSECAVTVANQTYELPDPFFTLATQTEGAFDDLFPLGAKQLDRFLFKLKTPFPNEADLATILDRSTAAQAPIAKPVMNTDRVIEMCGIVRQVEITDDVQSFAIKAVLATRPDQSTAPELVKKYVAQGSSPRGAQAMILGGKLFALLAGRAQVTKDDLAKAAHPALRHRFLLNFEGHADRVDADSLVEQVLQAAG